MNKVIAVDVDLTVFDTISPWLRWFDNLAGIKTNPKNLVQYDLIPYFKSVLESRGIHNVNPFSFWFQKDLYDEMEPIEGCKEKLKELHEQGNKIVFVSKCEPEHLRSKKKALEYYFPFMSGFIDTGDKQYCKYDALIDDNVSLVNRCKKHNPDAKHYVLTQLYHENLPCLISGHEDEVSHWNDIKL